MEKNNPFEKEPRQESLEDFQQEIENFKNKEIEEKKKKANPDLINIEVDKLTLDDMKAWQNYKKLTVENITEKDVEDFEEYRKSVYSDKELEPARISFAEFLSSPLSILWGKKELKELKEK
jgi:hypothetical protein